MLVAALVLVVGTVVVIGSGWLGWWCVGGGWDGLAGALLLGSFAASVVFGMYVPASFLWADAGSIRQAKRTLREAERDGRWIAASRARARLRLARWQRRG